jgi:acetyltransferase-like isoleucine patch superfamily enzyme
VGNSGLSAARTIAETLAAAIVLPLRALLAVRVISYETVGQLLSLIPGFSGVFMRRAWYSATLASCGEAVTVAFGALIHDRQAEIGDHCYFGKRSIVGYVVVGPDFMCGDHVQLLSGMRHHPFDRRDVPVRSQGSPAREQIVIGADVWIGAGAIVGADVAAHCIVAAGAVVAAPVDAPWTIIGGVPAKQLGVRP